MADGIRQIIRAIDRETLNRPARRALGSATATVENWSWTPLAYPALNPITAGLYRFQGDAIDGGQMRPWSLVLKIVRSPGERWRDPAGVDYWQREPLALTSEALSLLTTGFVAVRCLGVEERGADLVLLWLEELSDRFDGMWSTAQYSEAAQHLGRFNGACLCGRPLPEQPWWAHGVLRAIVAQRGGPAMLLAQEPATWETATVRHWFDRADAARLLRLWEARMQLLDALDRLPRVLCHNDVSRHNLFARRRPGAGAETVAIDWAYAGPGGVGEDLSLLVPSPFFRCEVDVSGLTTHAEAVFAGYLAGLRDAGWRGDVGLVRFGYAAASALRTAFIAPTLPALLDADARAAEERRWNRPLRAIMAQRAPLTRFLLDLGDGALALLARADRPGE